MIQNFKDFNLSPALHKALEAMKYQTPTPIQAEGIPVVLEGRDVIGCAQTGTGKTAAFCIPIITKLEKNPQTKALILVPTREIAAQILEVVRKLTAGLPDIKLALLIGGASMNAQIHSLGRKPRILVATPGRLLDHLRQRTMNLNQAEILVLDEADRMLDMGFAPQLNEVLRFLPKVRQTLLFSATLPNEIRKLAQKYLKEPVPITVGPVSQPVRQVTQATIQTTAAKKQDVLLDELNARTGSVLIFTRTKRRADKLARRLSECGHRVNRIHGDRTQAQRNAAIDGFRKGAFRILVATDIAARGIDIAHIAHVINYDLPQCPEDYVHRVGRTARAGAKGDALSILTPEDKTQWREISRLLAN